jgi:arylsulfatase A-like enzyme
MTPSARLVTLVAVAACLPAPRATGVAGAAEPRPNVLVIVSDDQGYVDAGFQGGVDVPTPHLDRLAASGVRCTSGYVSHPFCSPTRAGLLTGRYQARFGHENNPVYDPLDPTEGLPLGERILPQLVKPAGYATGWVGKWHLGGSPAHAPWARGFDDTFGFIGGGHRFLGWKPDGRQYTLPLVRQGEPIDDLPAHLTAALGDQAAAFVLRHAGHPWLLYLAFNAPHTPHEPTAEREARFAHVPDPQRRRYLAQVSLLDDAIGSVTQAVTESGQAGRTLVFFCSDNGGPVKNAAVNGPLRGGKGQLYEGGIRVPFIVSWPDRLPAGRSYDRPVSSLDVVATALAAAGVPHPRDKPYDGVDLVPHLAGRAQGPPHERLFWRLAYGRGQAVREGRWKLVRTKDRPDELYDLDTDLAEAKDLATVEPAIASRLAAALDAWTKQLVDPVFPGSSAKSEDWGPGGANQKGKPDAAPGSGRPKKTGDRGPKPPADAASASAASLIPAGNHTAPHATDHVRQARAAHLGECGADRA